MNGETYGNQIDCSMHGMQLMDKNGDCEKCAAEKKTEIVEFSSGEQSRIGSAITAAMSERPTEIGAALVRQATERGNKAFMENVQNRVQEMVSHLNNLFLAKEKLDKEIALFQRRIKAVEAGEFKVEHSQGEFGARLIFNDILLNY
jgi:hypothetical protein